MISDTCWPKGDKTHRTESDGTNPDSLCVCMSISQCICVRLYVNLSMCAWVCQSFSVCVGVCLHMCLYSFFSMCVPAVASANPVNEIPEAPGLNRLRHPSSSTSGSSDLPLQSWRPAITSRPIIHQAGSVAGGVVIVLITLCGSSAYTFTMLAPLKLPAGYFHPSYDKD